MEQLRFEEAGALVEEEKLLRESKRISAVQAQNATSIILKATALAFQYKFDMAENSYKNAIRVHNSFDTNHALALFLYKQQKFAEALSYYQKLCSCEYEW